MKRAIVVLIGVLWVQLSPLFSQDSTATEPQSVSSSPSEEAMSIIATATLIPLAFGSTVIGIVPPSGGVIIHDGKIDGLLSFETGVGFGTRANLKRFSDLRVTVVYAHVYSAPSWNLCRLEVKKDLHVGFIDRREIVLFGVSPAAGVFTDFPSKGYSVGVSSWLMTPWLSYFGFIPQHTFGVNYRYNRYVDGRAFGEISAGISSAFTWGW